MAYQNDRIKQIPAPLPVDYDRQTNFTDYQTANPGQPMQGAALDAEFNVIEQAMDEIQARARLIQRDDGALQNKIVTRDSLAEEVIVGVNSPTTWTVSTVYAETDSVIVYNEPGQVDPAWYVCEVGHTAVDFAADLAAGRWRLLVDLGTLLADAGQTVVVSGSGTETFTDALNGRPIVFDNEAAMIAQTALIEGLTVITLGKTTPGDGEGQTFQIVASGGDVTLDNGNEALIVSKVKSASGANQTFSAALDDRVVRVGSVAEMTLLEPTGVVSVEVTDTTQQGVFNWDPVSVANVDNFTVFKSDTLTTGRFIRSFNGPALAVWAGDFATENNIDLMNIVIAYINATGSPNRTSYDAVRVHFPAGVYDFTAAGIDPILVSNVVITADKNAFFELRDGPVFTLGSAAQFVEEIKIIGGYPWTPFFTEIPLAATWVFSENSARVVISELSGSRVPMVLKIVSAAGSFTTTYTISNSVFTAMPDREMVNIDSTLASGAAGLFLDGVRAFPTIPPANPTILPIGVTAASNTNPVVVTTAANHGFSTGDRIRLRDLGGMTQVNGNDYTITVTSPTAFSLDGVDGTAFGTYTTGGAAVERHWSWEFEKAAIKIKGFWDTAIADNCFFMHWGYMWHIEPTETNPILFLWDRASTFDYGGISRFKFDMNGGSISNVSVEGGWNFTLDGDYFEINEIDPSGAILTAKVSDHKIGLVGGSIVPENTRMQDISFSNVQVGASNRLSTGTSYGFRFTSGNNKPVLSGVRYLSGVSGYGPNADLYLVPTTSFSVAGSVTRIIENCVSNSTGAGYDLNVRTVKNSSRVEGNRKLDGNNPEYMSVISPSIATGAWEWTNHSGGNVNFSVRGGTVSSIEISYTSDSSGSQIFLPTGQTSGVFSISHGQTIRVNNTVTPLVYAIPIN